MSSLTYQHESSKHDRLPDFELLQLPEVCRRNFPEGIFPPSTALLEILRAGLQQLDGGGKLVELRLGATLRRLHLGPPAFQSLQVDCRLLGAQVFDSCLKLEK